MQRPREGSVPGRKGDGAGGGGAHERASLVALFCEYCPRVDTASREHLYREHASRSQAGAGEQLSLSRWELTCMLSEGEFLIQSRAPGMEACLKAVCAAGDGHSVGGEPRPESAEEAWELVSAQVRPKGLCHT